MTKLSEFLDEHQIDTRRLLATSRRIEVTRPEDRAIRLARRVVKKGKPTDAQSTLAQEQPRSGRPVSRPALDKALCGKRLSAAARARVTRAVNHVLAARKKKEVTVADLF